MGEVVRHGNLTESESSSVSLFFPISLLLPYLQSNLSDSSRVCCSHRPGLQPNPWAGWAACTLLKNECFKIFTQEARAVFSNDSKPLLPKPWGAQSSRPGQGWVVQLCLHCFPFSSASINYRALFVPSPCWVVTNGHLEVPSIKGRKSSLCLI